MYFTHPLSITLCQVIIDGNDMDTFAATDHAWRIYNFRYGVNLFPLNTV